MQVCRPINYQTTTYHWTLPLPKRLQRYPTFPLPHTGTKSLLLPVNCFFFLLQLISLPDSLPCWSNFYSIFLNYLFSACSCTDLLEDTGDDDLLHVRLVHGQVLIAFNKLHNRLHSWVQLQGVELLLKVLVQVLQLWCHILQGSILHLTHIHHQQSNNWGNISDRVKHRQTLHQDLRYHAQQKWTWMQQRSAISKWLIFTVSASCV